MFIRGSGSSSNVEPGRRPGGGEEEPTEIVDLDPVLDGARTLGQLVVELGELRVDGYELGGVGVPVGIGDRPHHAVVVREHGNRPPFDLRVALDGEHDVFLALVLERGLELHQRARHGEGIERRDLIPAQVEALVGLGQRQARPDHRSGHDGSHDQHGPEHQPAPVRRHRGGVELVADRARHDPPGETLGGRDQRQGAGEDAGALEEGQPALLDGEQQAQREGEEGTDRGQPGPAAVAGDLAADRGGQPGDGERQRPQLDGDVRRWGRREEIRPSVDQPAGEVAVGAGQSGCRRPPRRRAP